MDSESNEIFLPSILFPKVYVCVCSIVKCSLLKPKITIIIYLQKRLLLFYIQFNSIYNSLISLHTGRYKCYCYSCLKYNSSKCFNSLKLFNMMRIVESFHHSIPQNSFVISVNCFPVLRRAIYTSSVIFSVARSARWIC